MAKSARAQCCGDCNGDGVVTINELITAVNNALSACGAATPTPERTLTPTRILTPTHIPTPTHKPTATPTLPPHCPFTFSDSNGNPVCAFQGTYNRGCGSALNSIFLSDGTSVTVEIATMVSPQTVLYFSAHVDSPTSASLTGWSIDALQTINTVAGVVQLTDNGNQLVVFPNDWTLMILGCDFVQYIGSYIGSGGAFAERAALSVDAERSATLDRLRPRRERPIPNLGPP